jgi:hypothetical protein
MTMTNTELRRASIYTIGVAHRTQKCIVCGDVITLNNGAAASHGKKHVRDGTVV